MATRQTTKRESKRESLLNRTRKRFQQGSTKESFNANTTRASAADRPTRSRTKNEKGKR